LASRTPRKRPATAARKRPATAAPSDFAAVFAGLRRLLAPYARRMAVKHDTPVAYYLESTAANRYGEHVFFGAVRTGKSYVSFHLMPIYVFPDLARTLSPELKRRMQGKSCFNFRTVDRALFKELKELTARGYEQFERGGVFGK
jgi:hypothetical protein